MLRIIKKVLVYLLVFILTGFATWLVHLGMQGPDAAILMYHSIGEPVEKASGLNVSQEVFERQMRFLRNHHYCVLSLSELVRKLRAKEKITARTVVITFDDGYENNFTRAVPILKKYGIPATIFVIADYLAKEEIMYGHRFQFMTPEMLKEASDSGLIAIGSHTKSHPFLPSLEDPKRLGEELVGSKRALEKILGVAVDFLCYPVGGYDRRVQAAVRQAGYKAAVTSLLKKGSVQDDLYALKRIKITERSKNMFIFFIQTSGYYLQMKQTSR
ncbi:MAG: polysaccharide deacetylase family protein [Candidatus Omnitrophota bacterium]